MRSQARFLMSDKRKIGCEFIIMIVCRLLKSVKRKQLHLVKLSVVKKLVSNVGCRTLDKREHTSVVQIINSCTRDVKRANCSCNITATGVLTSSDCV